MISPEILIKFMRTNYREQDFKMFLGRCSFILRMSLAQVSLHLVDSNFMRECESATANLLKYISSLAMLFVVVNNISQQDEKIRQNLFLKLLSRLLGSRENARRS